MQNNSPVNAQNGKGVAQTVATAAITTTATSATATETETQGIGGTGASGATAGAAVHSLSNASTEAASSSPSSTYSSWTVPSLDSLFSVRRASAFGARYGLIPSHVSTLTPGRKSPATSSMSLILEGGASAASLQSKARRSESLLATWPFFRSLKSCLWLLINAYYHLYAAVSARLSESITSVLNDSSLVFYRINGHIHKKVPQFVEEKV